MGGTTITIQEDTLLKAFDELIEQRKVIEDLHHLFLNSIIILGKEKDEYYAIGDKGIEASVGTQYPFGSCTFPIFQLDKSALNLPKKKQVINMKWQMVNGIMIFCFPLFANKFYQMPFNLLNIKIERTW